jgi:hypothetical protein
MDNHRAGQNRAHRKRKTGTVVSFSPVILVSYPINHQKTNVVNVNTMTLTRMNIKHFLTRLAIAIYEFFKKFVKTCKLYVEAQSEPKSMFASNTLFSVVLPPGWGNDLPRPLAEITKLISIAAIVYLIIMLIINYKKIAWRYENTYRIFCSIISTPAKICSESGHSKTICYHHHYQWPIK